MAPNPRSSDIASIEEIIIEMRAGRMVILVDEEDRENEGDLVLPAEHVTPEAINFMVTHARGLVCLTITEARAKQIGLTPMARANNSPYSTAFTVSIEAAEGVTTGISAQDRARTIEVAVSREARPEDIVQPGHIFPIVARPGGVLVRAGHTEAGCDLAQMAGLEPSSVICEILKEDGTMARLPDLIEFAKKHGLKIGTIADLIHYRLIHERTVERVSEQPLDTELGQFTLVTYRDGVENTAHMALTLGKVCAEESTLVRVHNMEPLRDLFLVKQPGRWSLRAAMAEVAKAGSGVVLLLGNPLTGPELLAHLGGKQPAPSPATYSTVGAGSQILRDLGVRKMRLMSAPMKFNAISGFDLEVVEYLPAE